MPTKRTHEFYQEFTRYWEYAAEKGLKTQDVASRFKVGLRQANIIRRDCEHVMGMILPSLGRPGGHVLPRLEHLEIAPKKKKFNVLVGSDWHIWPGEPAFAERIFLKTLEAHKFDYVVLNGDVLDLPSVSRHAPLPGEHKPSVGEEIEEAKERVTAVEKLAGRAKKIWAWGNHDERLDKMLAKNMPSLADFAGVSIEEMFPKWTFCLSADICEQIVIKHSWHTSMHAAFHNTRNSGRSMVTGHTHRLLVRRYNDYTGIRYGIETGTLADPHGPQFRYTENNPRDWHPGFLILDVEQCEDGYDIHPQLVDCSLRKPVVYGKAL